jgi:hypothetical protein
MNRECKILNLDECRTRSDCATRKKPKSEELMCYKKPVREEKPVVQKPISNTPKVRAPSMTAARRAAILATENVQRSKLPFGKEGSFCANMTEKDCGKAKIACHWIKESADGKRKAHCGRRTETKYDSMNALHTFNSKKYQEEPVEMSPEEIKQARWAKAAAAVNTMERPKLPFGKDGSFCVGMSETDCGKAKSCRWTKASADGKRKGHCGRRAEGKTIAHEGVGTKVGGSKQQRKLKIGDYYYYGEVENGQANGYGELYESDKKTLVHRGQFRNNRF